MWIRFMGNDYKEREQTEIPLSFSFLQAYFKKKIKKLFVKWFVGHFEDADWLSDMDKGWNKD